MRPAEHATSGTVAHDRYVVAGDEGSFAAGLLTQEALEPQAAPVRFHDRDACLPRDRLLRRSEHLPGAVLLFGPPHNGPRAAHGSIPPLADTSVKGNKVRPAGFAQDRRRSVRSNFMPSAHA